MWGDPAAAHQLSSPASPLSVPLEEEDTCTSTDGGGAATATATEEVRVGADPAHSAAAEAARAALLAAFGPPRLQRRLPLSAPEWTRLFLQYDVLVHLELLDGEWEHIVVNTRSSMDAGTDSGGGRRRGRCSVVAAACANLVGSLRLRSSGSGGRVSRLGSCGK